MWVEIDTAKLQLIAKEIKAEKIKLFIGVVEKGEDPSFIVIPVSDEKCHVVQVRPI